MEEVIDEATDDADDVVLWDGTEDDEKQLLISIQLKPTQRTELDELLQEFGDVLSNCPGKTQSAECRINTGRAPLIRLPPYRLPHAYRDIVKSKLEEMERDGIIEHSSSEWAFPVVLIKKRGSSLRMCENYRQLNAIADANAYLMPRVDDIINALGKAQ